MNVTDIPIYLLDQIGSIHKISLPQQGHTSLVIKIETREHQFIIKKTEHELYNEWLLEEYNALQSISSAGIPVPKVHAFHKQGKSRWLLMDYIEGISLRHFLAGKPDPKDRERVIAEYGLSLKQIHETKCPANLHRQSDISWLDSMFTQAGHNLKNYGVAGTEELLVRLRDTPLQPVENTFIHGDYHTNNVLVQHNKVVGIIDWPRAAFGDPRFDIALAIRPKQGVFDQTGDKDIFLEAYDRLTITEEEYLFFQEGLYQFF